MSSGVMVDFTAVLPLKWICRLGDSLGLHRRRWSQASTSPVNTRAVTMTTFLFLCPRNFPDAEKSRIDIPWDILIYHRRLDICRVCKNIKIPLISARVPLISTGVLAHCQAIPNFTKMCIKLQRCSPSSQKLPLLHTGIFADIPFVSYYANIVELNLRHLAVALYHWRILPYTLVWFLFACRYSQSVHQRNSSGASS